MSRHAPGRWILIALILLAPTACSGEKPTERPSEQAQAIRGWIGRQMPALADTYKRLHLAPEVSFEEKETAAFMAEAWTAAGYAVTEDIGGYGVVAILENGDGPTVMIRCDMDALPVTEETGLPFASQIKTTLPDGSRAGVMHACGHDLHMTNAIAVSQYMAEHRDEWSGTLMVIAQPAEERGAGARAMLNDGLFTKFPKPDHAVALHVGHDLPAGEIAVLPGYAQANVDSVDIKVKGRGGHGSAPHTTIDPIVQAAQLVVDLQTIVSREMNPREPAVVTVGSIHGGTKHNIIGDTCHLQLTVRSYDQDVRKNLLSSIERKAKAVANSFGAPEPEVVFSEGTPSLRNDPALTARLRSVFENAIGSDNIITPDPSMGGEDFSQYGIAGVPILMYRLGTVSKARLDRFKKLGVPPPSLHSSRYYPDLEKSLTTGVLTMTMAALDLLRPREKSAEQ